MFAEQIEKPGVLMHFGCNITGQVNNAVQARTVYIQSLPELGGIISALLSVEIG